MAKELERYTKEFAPLKRTSEQVLRDYKMHCISRQNFAQVLLEAANEFERVVQQLKDGGMTGTKVSDFAGARELAPTMKLANEAKAGLDKEQARLDRTILKPGREAYATLVRLADELDHEVTDRKKKKDRAVFAVDSKSLPALEKLLKEMNELAGELDLKMFKEEGKDAGRPSGWSAERQAALFDRNCTWALTSTKASVAAKDKNQLDAQLTNGRTMARAKSNAAATVKAIQTSCADAGKAQRAGDIAEAEAQLNEAKRQHGLLVQTMAPYTRIFGAFSDRDLANAQADKDGKAAVDFWRNGVTAIDQMAKLIKTQSRTAMRVGAPNAG